MHNKTRAGGFTIIEVVLVLAIAGLIFLIVFLAIPALQRAARDQQRRSDVSQLAGAVDNWRTNNPGDDFNSEAELRAFAEEYFDDEHREPTTGEPYELEYRGIYASHLSEPPPIGTISYTVSHHCGSDPGHHTFVTIEEGRSHSNRLYAITVTLESGNTVYCVDNG